MVIIGGGASAVLVADAVRRCRRSRRPLRLAVVERQHAPGRGVAYSTDDAAHRMNVPARRLSIDPGQPDHLLRWLAEQGDPAEPEAYIRRQRYGDYLAAVLATVGEGTSGVELTILADTAVAVERAPEGHRISLATGPDLVAGHVVLATGPAPGPAPIPLTDVLESGARVVLDPWAEGALDSLESASRVVVVGTGLTMVDAALTLCSRPDVVVDAVSRHGWLPQPHPEVRRAAELPSGLPPGNLTAAQVRRALVEHSCQEPAGWEASVDLFRDLSHHLWPLLTHAEQAKLLRRPAAVWRVHRHRMAPPVAAAMDELVAAGRIRVHAGRVHAITGDAAGIAVRVAARHRDPYDLEADALVACLGPSSDIGATDDPLLRHLIDSGLARIGPHRLGLAVDPCGVVLDPENNPVHGLLTIGPLRRGCVFETTAIPELRIQAGDVAHRIVADPSPKR